MSEPKVQRVAIWLCELCLGGLGESCNVPGCALCRHNSPGYPIDPAMYEIIPPPSEPIGGAPECCYDTHTPREACPRRARGSTPAPSEPSGGAPRCDGSGVIRYYARGGSAGYGSDEVCRNCGEDRPNG